MSRHFPLPTLRRATLGLTLAATLTLAGCGGSDDKGSTTAEAAADPVAASASSATPAAAEGGHDEHAEGEADDNAAGEESTKSAAALPADAEFNAQDVKFLQHMIDHHGQAVDMSDMALKMEASPQVKALAEAIHGAQAPEIELMTGWLKEWKQSTENAPHDHDPNAPSAGMMTEEDMAKLHATKNQKEFDKLFLKQMIFHHQGALNQSKTQLEKGEFAEAKKLAQKIIKAQKAEIAKMKKMMKSL